MKNKRKGEGRSKIKDDNDFSISNCLSKDELSSPHASARFIIPMLNILSNYHQAPNYKTTKS